MITVDAVGRLVTIVSAAFTVAIVGGAKAPEAPSPSWTTRAKVLRVIDGDTVEVEIRRTVRVRMLGCWSPEKKGRLQATKGKTGF